MSSGVFITFEGGEGTGKSTQARLLKEFLWKKHRISALLTREPGGSDGAEAVRQLILTGATNRWFPESELLLMYAARIDHWKRWIQPSLNAGTWVICDRFIDSTVAYQGYGHGLDLIFIDELQRFSLQAHCPDLTFMLDADPVVGVDRAQRRLKLAATAEDRFESLEASFHQRVRQGFLEIAKKNAHRCNVIDAMRDIPVIQSDIQTCVNTFIKTIPHTN